MSLNDVELFDLESDPAELENLATDVNRYNDLLAINDKMNVLIDAEVGADNGSFLPGRVDNWAATTFDPQFRPTGATHEKAGGTR